MLKKDLSDKAVIFIFFKETKEDFYDKTYHHFETETSLAHVLKMNNPQFLMV